MFQTNVYWHSIGTRLRSVLGYSVAAVAVTTMYVGVFPSFQDQMVGYAEAMPKGMAAFMGNDFASPAGYLQSTIFTIMGPLLVVASAVTWGAGTIAGEEENHTLPLLLSTPVPRLRLAWHKLAAVLSTVTVIAAVVCLALLATVSAADIDVPAGDILAAALHLHALGIFAAGLAVGAGAATGRRVLAIGVAAGAVVGGFVLSGVAGMLEADTVRWLSPFYWFNGSEPIRNGVDGLRLALLYGVGGAAALLGILRFNRRDLR
jgi:ABC-2 type transport system permease protein